jgi:hypothetical protein
MAYRRYEAINDILQDKMLFAGDHPGPLTQRFCKARDQTEGAEGECKEAAEHPGLMSAPPPLARPTLLERVHQSVKR